MDILVLVVWVDPGPRFKERLHEQVQEGRHPDELNRRRVPAGNKQVVEDGDVGWIQGPLGQHGPQGLAQPGVGGSSAQGKWDEVAQSCPTLCNPTRLLCPWDFPGKNTGVGCHFLIQGIFPTQGLNLSLLMGRWILYH